MLKSISLWVENELFVISFEKYYEKRYYFSCRMNKNALLLSLKYK